MTQTVKVMVRCRPMNNRQKELNCQIVTEIDSKNNQINLYQSKNKSNGKSFIFDHVFGSESMQSQIYEQSTFTLVDNVIEGYNGTIFAYGQTGCGKTYTMMGYSNSSQLKGIIPRTFNHIIAFINNETEKKHLVQCSFIEIYNEEIHDLLSQNTKNKMVVKESVSKGVFVENLTMNIVKTSSEMEHFMEVGMKNRATRETAMNKQSSRSHSIFTIYIQSEEMDQLGQQKFKVGKLNLVDLAGSERQSKTHAVGDGIKEAAKINLSLSALGNVISALVDGKSHHIPYRDSKLTRLLQDSLGGNTKTIMIAAISPASDNYEQTLSTLRYASRAKFIQNKPVINQDPKDALLRQYAEEIKELKLILEGRMTVRQTMFVKEGYKCSNGDNQQLQNQLNFKQQRLKIEYEEKEKLKVQLQNLQNLISNDISQSDKKEIERMKKLKEKLKVQRKKMDEWKQQRKKHDEQLMTVEKNYNSLKEEVEEVRTKFKQLKKKYMESLYQLNDVREAAERQKQQLLSTIRAQQAEINKYSGICCMLLSANQIQQIIAQSQFNEETREWVITPFCYKEKTISFPKLATNKKSELIQLQKNKKQVTLKIGLKKEESCSKFKPIYKISEVVKGAREHNNQRELTPSYNNITVRKHYKRHNATQFSNEKNLQLVSLIGKQKSGRSQQDLSNPEQGTLQKMVTLNILSNKKMKLKPIMSTEESRRMKTLDEMKWC